MPPACVPDDYHGECHANHIRKMQASFSWDWGPAFPGLGIWQPIKIVSQDSLDEIIIDTIKWTVEDRGNVWQVRVDVEADGCNDLNPDQSLMLMIEDVTDWTVPGDYDDCHWTMSDWNISKTLVETWWPNGK